jgi:hypothetical protein
MGSGVSCASTTSCTAIGYFIDIGGAREPLSEFWDGTRWTILTTAGQIGGNLNAVSCSSATACTAVGVFFTVSAPAPWPSAGTAAPGRPKPHHLPVADR